MNRATESDSDAEKMLPSTVFPVGGGTTLFTTEPEEGPMPSRPVPSGPTVVLTSTAGQRDVSDQTIL